MRLGVRALTVVGDALAVGTGTMTACDGRVLTSAIAQRWTVAFVTARHLASCCSPRSAGRLRCAMELAREGG